MKFTRPVCGLAIAMAGFVATAQAQDKTKIDDRLNAAASVIEEVMAAPDHAIPETVLGHAHCVIVIPSEKKAAFGVGAQYRPGRQHLPHRPRLERPRLCTPRRASFGFQIGGQATDLVLLGMNQKSVQDMLHSKVKLGANASAAAGPVGRDAQAATDVMMNAEFLTYSRAKGLFAGLDLSGDVLDANGDDMQAEYGADVHNDAVLHGAVPVRPNAEHFVHTVAKYFVISKHWKTMTPPKNPDTH